MRFDSLLFDLDGTLWDTCDTCAIAWNAVLARHNIPFRTITGNDVRSVCGQPHEHCIRTVFQGLPDETLNLLVEKTMEEDNSMIQKTGGTLYGGVCEGIATLAEQYKLFIVSNCQSGYIENFLQYSRCAEYFQDYECWGHTGRSKTENTRAIIDRNNLRAPLLIGDTSGDRVAAREVGIPFGFLSYGFGNVTEYDYRFDSFPELTSWLLTLATH
jgi:phosphoglycolate phosphatase